MGALLVEPGGVKEALEIGNSFHGGLSKKPERGFICQGLMCGKRFWNGCLHIGAPLGNLGRGGGSIYWKL